MKEDIIKLLPDTIANQIAAGEVVQRPASVVKELLENSVDAESTSIKLIVKDAGKQLIQVIDNGKGMSETDARMCFERHATSKIKDIEDIYHINTLGFRGEAMASIAAVAEVELRTKRIEDKEGTLILIDNNQVKLHEPCATLDGTNISVKNLFFNTPARKKFLKSNQNEFQHILEEFIRVAIANPHISFAFINDNEEIHQVKSGTLRQRILQLFSKKYDEMLIPIDEDTEIITVKGFVTKPDAAMKKKRDQYFIVNGRFIKSGYLHHAVVSAYEGIISSEYTPFYVLQLTIPHDRIDINIHPTKTEIKFVDEKYIYPILRTSIRKALHHYQVVPSISFETEESLPFTETFSSAQQIEFSQGFQDNNIQRNYTQTTIKSGDWDAFYKVLSSEANQNTSPNNVEELEGLPINYQNTKSFFQLHQKYIVSTLKSGIIIIQQHFAHQRILFEKLLKAWEDKNIPSQRLLFPEVLELELTEGKAILELKHKLLELGYDVSEFGKNSFIIESVPQFLEQANHKELITSIVNQYKNYEQLDSNKILQYLIGILAEKAAIKSGVSLKEDEIRQLIDELFACKEPFFSPKGKPTLITISEMELNRKFGL